MTQPANLTDTLIVAGAAFMDVARREWINRNPDQPCPIPVFAALDMGSRRSFLKCIGAALRASDPKNVQAAIERMWGAQNDG